MIRNRSDLDDFLLGDTSEVIFPPLGEPLETHIVSLWAAGLVELHSGRPSVKETILDPCLGRHGKVGISPNYKALQVGIHRASPLEKGFLKITQVFLVLVFQSQGIIIKNFPNISSSWKSVNI